MDSLTCEDGVYWTLTLLSILASVVLLAILVCMYFYPFIGVSSLEIILSFEHRIKKYFKKPAVIVVDAPSYFNQRKSKYNKILLALFIAGHTIVI